MARRCAKRPLNNDFCRVLEQTCNLHIWKDNTFIALERQNKSGLITTKTTEVGEYSLINVAIESALVTCPLF